MKRPAEFLQVQFCFAIYDSVASRDRFDVCFHTVDVRT